MLILIPYHFATSSRLLDICVDTRRWRSLNAAFMNCVLTDCKKTVNSSRKNLAIHVLSTLSVFIYLKLTTTMISFQVQWYPRCQLVRNAFNSKLLKRTRRGWLFTTWNLFGPFQDSLWSTRSVKIAMKSHWLDCFCTLRDQLRSPK